MNAASCTSGTFAPGLAPAEQSATEAPAWSPRRKVAVCAGLAAAAWAVVLLPVWLIVA